MAPIYKDYIRAIKTSFGRFASILLIIAIGAGFYAGLRSTGSDMRQTADEYYSNNRLMDLKVTGNYGLDDGDIELIGTMPYVTGVTGSYSADLFVRPTGSNVRAMSYSPDPEGVNIPDLVTGRFPETADECVVDHTALGDLFNIGDTIEFYLKESNTSNILTRTAFTVVGTATSPLYISNDRDYSAIGNGNSDGFILLMPEAFAFEYYTEVYIHFVESDALSSFSDDYLEATNEKVDSVYRLLTENVLDRYARLVKVPQAAIEEMEAAYASSSDMLAAEQENLAAAQAILDEAQAVASVSAQDLAALESDINARTATVNAREQEVNNAVSNAPAIEAGFAREQDTLVRERADWEQRDAEWNNQHSMYAAMENPPLSDEELQAIRSQLDQELEDWQARNDDLAVRMAQHESDKNNAAAALLEIADERQSIQEAEEVLAEAREVHGLREQAIADAQIVVETAEALIEEAAETMANLTSKIQEANRELSRMERINYYIYDRNVNPTYQQYAANANRIDAIALVFPLLFILVAALVCLTAMTRMVEEETTVIGIYKALGYSNASIIMKYIHYAFTATLLGCIVGLGIGFKVFPAVIMRAYGILYNMPDPVTPFRLDLALLTTLVALMCTTFAAWYACRHELKASPAVLMRPKSPKGGKRILLERIGFLWKHMGFNQKVTARNLFRYKKRMFMTLIGITGCAALMLTGFGLRNALTDIVDLQFDELFHYDMTIIIDEDTDEYQHMALNAILSNYTANGLYIYQQSVTAYNGGNNEDVALMVGREGDHIENFITFRDRVTHEPIEFTPTSVIITEKLASLLGVGVGDTIALYDGANQYMANVTGITENYVNHYVYMGEYIYSQYFGSVPNYTSIMIQFPTEDPEDIDLVAESLNGMSYVRQASLTANLRQQYTDLLSSLNMIVYVLIVSAALLAFVVLYNLTTINISERMRELSTIKVLGFYNGEVTGYIGRENFILTLIGTLLGLGIGIFLCRFVVTTTEVEAIMFGRNIQVESYILSAALTFVFALAVNIAMHFRLKKINMVEALKSTE